MQISTVNPTMKAKTQYILEEDYCRNPFLWDESPYCGDSCGIPYCGMTYTTLYKLPRQLHKIYAYVNVVHSYSMYVVIQCIQMFVKHNIQAQMMQDLLYLAFK